jgi:hypothetical protein
MGGDFSSAPEGPLGLGGGDSCPAVPETEKGSSPNMRKLLIAATLAVAMLLPSSALASSHHPKGEFASFTECPLSNPNVIFCVFSESSGGFFQIGKKTVPLKNPVTLQGGLTATGFVGAENGETLSKTPQPVPGGLFGIVAPKWWPLFLQEWFNNQINEGATGVNATVEVAGPATGIKVNAINILFESGIGLSLPTKIKLSNPILGSSCYIGSDSSPVVIDFTSGETSPPPPNKPIHGSAGTFFENEAGTFFSLSGGSLVNNSFAAPGASGCGGLFSFFIDPLVNSLIGLPSPAGTNSAVLEGVLKNGVATAVKASE